VILAAIVVVILVAVAQRGGTPDTASTAETAAVVASVTSIPASVWNAAGSSGATAPILLPAADRPTGTPTLLYMGAEYCPYCAAERWVLVSALSRFGSFQGLKLTTSSSTDIYPNTPTFAFDQATYHSSAITVQTVEMETRTEQPLQTPTATQQALIDKYDAAPYLPQGEQTGSIPFILVGGKFMWSGAQYSPGLLSGMSWSKVADPLPAGSTALSKTILANGNMMSAAICNVDGDQPAAVCASSGVQAAAALLPKGS